VVVLHKVGGGFQLSNKLTVTVTVTVIVTVIYMHTHTHIYCINRCLFPYAHAHAHASLARSRSRSRLTGTLTLTLISLHQPETTATFGTAAFTDHVTLTMTSPLPPASVAQIWQCSFCVSYVMGGPRWRVALVVSLLGFNQGSGRQIDLGWFGLLKIN
jgi:hypothetical protein